MIIFNKLNNIKKFPYYFASPLNFAIGTAAEQVYISNYVAKQNRKKLILLFPNYINKKKYSICNEYFFSKLETYEKKFLDKFFFFLFNILFNILLFFQKANYPDLGVSLLNLHGKQKIIDKIEVNKFFKNQFSLPKEDDSEFYDILKKNTKYSDKQKIVTIHFRDEIYRNDKGRRMYRNSSIKNSYDAINYLIDKGYFVIRVGNLSKDKFELKNNNFFDYSFSELISEKLDLFLIKNSSFFIGTQSGLTEIAYLFNVPVMVLNMYQLFEGYPKKKCDRGLFKKILYKKDEISLSDFMNLNPIYHNSLVHNSNYINDLDFIENDGLEVNNAIQNFENLYSKNKLNEQSLIQKQFNKNLKEKIFDIYNYNIEKVNQNSNFLNPSEESLKNIRYNLFLNGAIMNINLNY